MTALFLAILTCATLFGTTALAAEPILTGTVVSADGSVVEDAVVTFTPSGRTTMTGNDGRFVFEGVSPGWYSLMVAKPLSPFGNAVVRVTVGEGESVDIRVTLPNRLYHVDEVVVVSKGVNEDDTRNRPANVTVVERADFEKKTSTVAEIIASTPGASITSMGGLGSYTDVSLRGAYSNQVQVYLDGILLNDAEGGSVNLGSIPVAQVERIDVWRSGAPATLGGNGSGGAINIVTRDTRTSGSSVSAQYGSFSSYAAHGITNVRRGTSRFLVSGDYVRSANDYEYTSDNGTPLFPGDDYDARRHNNGYRSTGLLLKYSHLATSGLLVEASEQFIDNEKDLPASQNIRYASASLATRKNLFQVKGTWNPSSLPAFEFAPAFHHIYTRERFRDFDGSVGWGMQDNRYATNAFTWTVPVTFTHNNIASVTVTPTARHESFRPEYRIEDTIPLDSDREQIAVASDLVLQNPDQRLTVTAGLRRDRYFSYFNGQTNTVNPVTPEPVFHYFTGSRAGIRFAFPLGLTLRANYGDTSRAPSLFELFGDRGTVVSNPNLVPERVFSRDIGLRWNIPDSPACSGGSIETVLFRNDFKNLIQWYTTNYGFVQPANVSASHVEGTEITANAIILGYIRWSGTMTFQNSRVTKTAKSYHMNKKLPNRPERYGVTTIEIPAGIVSVFWTVDHKGAYFLDRANQDHKRYPGRTLHDCGCTITVASGTHMKATVGNLTDVRTFDIQGMPKPGRSFSVSLNKDL